MGGNVLQPICDGYEKSSMGEAMCLLGQVVLKQGGNNTEARFLLELLLLQIFPGKFW